ncbi:MAG: MFS transporter [Abditibacteriales bacterium]|nr:MFS transporter [Abditibacteriales bacterium]MDW8367617.1 MFS transporter [Abditibacteriales bacterium]
MPRRILRNYFYIFHRYPLLLRLALVNVIAEMGWAMIFLPLQFYLVNELRYDVRHFSYCVLSFGLIEAIGKAPFGTLGDYIGRRPLIIGALLIGCPPLLLMSMTPSWALIAVFYGITGLAAAALWPTISALTAETVKPEDKAAAMSVFNTSYLIGLGLGPLVGLSVGGTFGNAWVFRMASGVLLVAAIVAYVVVRDHHAARDKPTRYGDEKITLHEVVSVLRDSPALIKMMLIYFASQFSIAIVGVMLGVYIEHAYKIPEARQPMLFIPAAVLVVGVALPLGRLSDKWGRPSAVCLSYLLGAVGMGLLFWCVNLYVALVCVALLGVSYALGVPAWLGLTSLHAPRHRQGQAIGLMNTAQGFGLVVGILCGGMLYDRFKDTLPEINFLVSSEVLTLCLLASLLLVREPSPKSLSAAPAAESAEARSDALDGAASGCYMNE